MSYSQYDDHPGADADAIHLGRLDVDIEMAEMAGVGDAIAATRKAGRCAHQGTKGAPGLKPGQSVCNDSGHGCGRVFDTDQDWYDAMDEAVFGG